MDWIDWRDPLCSLIWCSITKSEVQWITGSTTPCMVTCDNHVTKIWHKCLDHMTNFQPDLILYWPRDRIENKFYFHWFNQNETALNLFKWESLNHDSSWSRDPWFLIWYEPSIFILGGSFLHDFFEFSSQAIIVIVFAWKTIMEKCVHTMTFYCSESFTDESSVMTFPLDQRKFSGSYLPGPLFRHSCRDCEKRNSKKI